MMAISSIFADFCISDEETAEKFLHALELSEEKAYQDPIVPSSATITDPAEIRALLRKRKERKGTITRNKKRSYFMRYLPVFPKSLDEMQILPFQELVARWDQLTDLDKKSYIISSEGHEPLVLCPASWYHFWYSSEIDEVLYALCVQSAKDDEATVQHRLDLAHSLVGDICLDEVPKTLERLESVLPGHPLEQQWRKIMKDIHLRFEKLERSYSLRLGVLQVKAGQDYQVYLLCKDHKTRLLDMKPFLGKQGYGARLADLDFFHSRICVMHETLAWDTFGDGSEYTCIDFDPALLYINATVLSEEEAGKIWE